MGYGGRTIKVQKPTPAEGKGKGKGKDGKGKDKGKSNGKNNGPGEKPEGCLAVVLKGLAYSVNEQDLKDAFKKCGGGPTSVRMLNDKESGEFKASRSWILTTSRVWTRRSSCTARN